MKLKDYLGIVPEQTTGEKIETEESVELEDEEKATIFYKVAKERLLNVNKWHQVAGILTANFKAINNDGIELDRNIHKGDFMRIDIPGPGSKAGKGYDWVYVEELKEINDFDIESTGFRVRPSHNPEGSDQNSIAHFYDDSATSNFIITREGKKVSACIIDCNLKPNTKPKSVADKIRDTAVGMSAVGVFSKIQWKNLAIGLLNDKES